MLRASVILSGLIAFSANASIEDAFEQLNAQTAICQQNESSLKTVEDSWLLSLDDDSLKIALLMLKDSALRKCVAEQEKEYLYEIYLVYQQTGNRQPLEAYLGLMENRVISLHQEIVTEEFLDEIKRLSSTDLFSNTFDVLDEFKKIRSE
ncbi:hypothetical protein [Vibrio olivae]|uniref:Uncharacterized protein n=1 Tax=Vibrio olivae TaxID=1243002 RepID=A0ABV5HNB7_9VIBR